MALNTKQCSYGIRMHGRLGPTGHFLNNYFDLEFLALLGNSLFLHVYIYIYTSATQ